MIEILALRVSEEEDIKFLCTGSFAGREAEIIDRVTSQLLEKAGDAVADGNLSISWYGIVDIVCRRVAKEGILALCVGLDDGVSVAYLNTLDGTAVSIGYGAKDMTVETV